jgi:two-component system OmpR family response regulator
MRILLVEDDRRIAEFILKGLKEAGYAADHCDNGEDGLHLASTEAYARGHHRYHAAQTRWTNLN